MGEGKAGCCIKKEGCGNSNQMVRHLAVARLRKQPNFDNPTHTTPIKSIAQ